MSNTTQTTTDKEIRNAIVKRIEISSGVRVETILDDVSRDLGIADARVMDQLDKLERSGFVYLLGENPDTSSEVQLP